MLWRRQVWLCGFGAAIWGIASVGAGVARSQDRVTGRAFATRSEVIARQAMAATSQPLATQAALSILREGGNAVDAAIAANACLALMEPTGCGIGGDLFAMVWDAQSRTLHGFNGSGRSPESLTMDEFRRLKITKIPSTGPLPITVPGCVDGWFQLHERFGRLPMEQVLAPAIGYAEDGFPVSELIAFYWERGGKRLKDLPGFADTFLPEGRAPRKGELFRNPKLARTLQRLASEGRDVFYSGDLARAMDAFMKKHGGFLSYEDLAAHRGQWVEPVSVDYRGYRLWELPPNGQGIAALQILQILQGYDLRGAGFGSANHLHWFVEAKKLAFEDRARFYADPDFNNLPLAELISSQYAEQRRKLIDDRQAARKVASGNPALDQGDTIYLTVADAQRNMVSLIQSNYRGFGSGWCPDEMGFCFQDRGEMFDLTEGRFNSYAPKKRPFHTIIPAFVTRDDQPFLSFGVMGGATQPQGHAQIMINIVDFGMNFQEAGDAPRVQHEGSSEPTGERMEDGGRVLVESGMPYESIRELLVRGHKVGFDLGSYGGYQGIGYDPKLDVYYGASESRKDGQAAGY